jgi:hypothetical protein
MGYHEGHEKHEGKPQNGLYIFNETSRSPLAETADGRFPAPGGPIAFTVGQIYLRETGPMTSSAYADLKRPTILPWASKDLNATRNNQLVITRPR